MVSLPALLPTLQVRAMDHHYTGTQTFSKITKECGMSHMLLRFLMASEYSVLASAKKQRLKINYY